MRRIALLSRPVRSRCPRLQLAAGGGRSFPDRIDLPSGFAPEGIDIDHKGTFYVGRSRPARSTAQHPHRTGEHPRARARGRAGDRRGREPRPALRRRRPHGRAFVYDARDGRTLATYQLTTLPTFVNDVVVARGGAYFTDSRTRCSTGSRSIATAGWGPSRRRSRSPATSPTSRLQRQRDRRRPARKTLVIVQSNTGFSSR